MTSRPSGDFPTSLLSEPIEVRRDYFASKVILHPLLKQVYETALGSIRQAAKGTLIFIFGPTGVGKTTLRRKIANHLIQETLPELQRDPERIPVIEIEVLSPDSGRFDWTDYYTRSLKALQDVRVNYRLDHRVSVPLTPEAENHLGTNLTRRALRVALETALRQRRPIAFLHDEAQHFKAVAGAKQLLSQMDTIKSLASMTETILVFFGTYELLDLTNLSGQLGRRSLDIHFPRYTIESAEFKNVLWTFQRHLPLEKEPDLLQHYDYVYSQTAGCVGVLKDWLTRALELALREQAETVLESHLRQSALTQPKLLQMAREIQEGETQIQTTEKAEAEIRRLLQAPVSLKQRNQASVSRTAPASQPISARKQPRQVGERKPGRDWVS
jgi:Cdc6-like AAA superfamily ATPase